MLTKAIQFIRYFAKIYGDEMVYCIGLSTYNNINISNTTDAQLAQYLKLNNGDFELFPENSTPQGTTDEPCLSFGVGITGTFVSINMLSMNFIKVYVNGKKFIRDTQLKHVGITLKLETGTFEDFKAAIDLCLEQAKMNEQANNEFILGTKIYNEEMKIAKIDEDF